MSDLVERLLAGEVRALARAISLTEENDPRAVEIIRSVFPHTGRSTVVGLTGPPGAGKSSLVDRLLASWRADGSRVGVIAVDPSSAYSGGAILGDRVRMQQHATDPDVFIRSMATRGHLGGLARATNDAIDLFEAAGYDPILVETVGVGQDEIDVVKTADVVCVVLVPGMGDDIQALKAGILEIADLFVINKSDRPGADRLEADLNYMMTIVESERRRPEILRTVAVKDEGIAEFRRGVADYLQATSGTRRKERRRERAEARFRSLLTDRLLDQVLRKTLPGEALQQAIDEIAERRRDPYTVVQSILDRVEIQ